MDYVAQQSIQIVGIPSYYNIAASRWSYRILISGQEVEIIHFVEFLHVYIKLECTSVSTSF
jgi:hypothetical protein